MRHLAKNTISSVMPIFVLLISSYAIAQDLSNGDQISKTKQNVAVSVPELSDIIPEAAKLSGELVIHENKVRDLLDVSELEKKYSWEHVAKLTIKSYVKTIEKKLASKSRDA